MFLELPRHSSLLQLYSIAWISITIKSPFGKMLFFFPTISNISKIMNESEETLWQTQGKLTTAEPSSFAHAGPYKHVYTAKGLWCQKWKTYFCEPPRVLFRQPIINGTPDILISVYIEMTDVCKCIPMYTKDRIITLSCCIYTYVLHVVRTSGCDLSK